MPQTNNDIKAGQQLYVASFYHTRAPGRISIARRAPKGMETLPVYSKLAPGKWFHSVDQDEFYRLYYAEILAPLDPLQTMYELQAIVYPHDPVLLCWEKLVDPGDWCHRQLVQEYFLETLGLAVPELKKGEHPEELSAKPVNLDRQGVLFYRQGVLF